MLKLRHLLVFSIALVVAGVWGATALAQPFVVLDCDAGTLVGSAASWDCAAERGGGTTVSIIAAPSVLNPITLNDTASGNIVDQALGSGTATVYANLSAGVLGNIPQMASVIEVSEDGTTATFTVRDGVNFSDGTPVTMDDLLYWFNDVAFNPNLPNSATSIWTCPDGEPFDVQAEGNTVTVSCAAGFRTFAGNAGALGFWSKDMALELIDSQGIATEEGVIGPRATAEFMGLGIDIGLLRGIGPYVLKEFVSDQVARYERNPEFYEVDSNGVQLPYLDSFTYNIFPTNGQNLALSAFLNGQTETIGPRPADIAPILGQAAGGGFAVNSDIDNATPAAGEVFVTINYDDENSALAAVARNAKARKALSLAIDRVAAVNNVLLGIGTPQYTPVTLGGNAGATFFLGRNNTCDTFISTGLATADSCQDGVWTTDEGLTVQVTALPDPNVPGWHDHLVCLNDYASCVAQANSLLDELGLVDSDGDGIRDVPAGFDSVINNEAGSMRIQVTTNAGNTIREAYTQVICDGWTQIGIECSTNATSFSTLVTQLLGLGGATWTGGIVIGLTGGDPAGAVNVLKCGEALYFWHLSCDPSATEGPTAQVAEDKAVEEAFQAGFDATTVADAQAGFDQEQIAYAESNAIIHLSVQNALFAVRTDRICNDGRANHANGDVKFRVDIGDNAAACSTNVGR